MRNTVGTGPERGLTLVEVVVIMAIVSIVAASGFLILGQGRPARFDDDVQKTAAALKEMQADARSAKDNREFGVCFGADSWTTISRDPGDSADPCAAGYAGQIKTQSLSVATLAAIMTPPDTKVLFERVTGKTRDDASGTLTFTMASPDRTRTVRIESTGVIHVQ